MTLMAWLHAKLIGDRPRDICAEAMRATEDVTVKIRSLREQIQPFIKADDPFAAMTLAHDLASTYQREHAR